MKFIQKNPIPLPYWKYRLIMVVFVLIGLYASIHLTYTHYANYKMVSYQSFCALSRSLNCDTVAQSEYAVFMGVPVAVWGIYGYLFILFLLAAGFLKKIEDKRLWATLFLFSVIFCIISARYAYLSKRYVNSVCMLCVFTYFVNFGLFMTCLITIRRYSLNIFKEFVSDLSFYVKHIKVSVPVALVFLLLMGGLLKYYPNYWSFEDFPKSNLFDKGYTEEGFPWIGAKDPELVITEFSDYECFSCRKIHLALRQLVLQYPDKIRLIHRHFPMDLQCNPLVKEEYHKTACVQALIALCSGKQGEFWMVSDYLFYRERGRDLNAREMADALGIDFNQILECVNGEDSKKELMEDIRAGIELGIRATPGLIIEGELYEGYIPSERLNEYLEELSQ